MHYAPRDAEVPVQGWKVHLSARSADIERVLGTVWDYCVPRDLAFEFLRSRPVGIMYNAKSAFRGSSGKLVTVYPADADQLELVLKDLDALLAGARGPYILSDLRYGEGPIFVRYGVFPCTASRQRPAGARPPGRRRTTGAGRARAHVRAAAVGVLPAFLESHLAVRNSVTTTDLPYDIERVLHFSNGGGVYLGCEPAHRRAGRAQGRRPYAGLDLADRDAVARLRHERDLLERLSGLDAVPRVLDYFTLGDHEFLVQEFVDGTALQRMLVHRYPLTRADYRGSASEYTAWVLDVLDRVDRRSGRCTTAAWSSATCTPSNILVTAGGPGGADRLRGGHARRGPGPLDAGPPGVRRAAADGRRRRDRYALACMRLGPVRAADDDPAAITGARPARLAG